MKRLLPLAMALAVGFLSVSLIVRRMRSRAAEQVIRPAAQELSSRIVRGLGYVEPVNDLRHLTFATDGVVEQVHVELGQTVAAGAVLMTLENHVEKALVAEAEQLLALAVAEREQLFAGIHPEQIKAAEHQLELMTERLEHARSEQQRVEQLANKNAASGQERDRVATETRQAVQAQLQAAAELTRLRHHVRDQDRRVADAQVELAKSRLDLSRQRLKRTVLRAPFSGSVLEILKRRGEGVYSQDGQTVLYFADERHLQIRAEVDDRHVALLSEGLRAEVHGRGLGGHRYEGTVRVMKHVMGDKTVFSKAAAERKDLDVVQLLIAMPSEFRAPIGLQVDVDLFVSTDATFRRAASAERATARESD